ncbi:unnamed protein product [Orchesella dallaii]|uniref:Gustatory receptor n=1 Tax=Orchesella dallaii TaxID=48710 RepID=A0ABP1PWI6_9HEXA
MIEPEQTTALNKFISGNKSQIRPKAIGKTSRDVITSSQDPFITNTIINGAKWVFFSNCIVAFWPFSIKTTQDTQQKYLNFHFPTIGLFVTICYILLNVLYLTHYFIVKFHEYALQMQAFDHICLIIWDCMIIGGGTLCRIYGIWRMPKLHSFWNKIVNIVGQCTNLSSEREIKEKFRKLEKWGLKWFVTFTAIGIINGSAVFYNDLYNHNEPLLKVIIIEYIDTVISSHNASAFFLIFFIKIMTHGFIICRRKLEQTSNQNTDNIMFSTHNLKEKIDLQEVFKLIRDLEECVASFNTTFVFILFLEVTFSFWQVMFSLYFFHAVDPLSNFLAGINMMIPILSYSTCLVCLCHESSKLTGECQKMVGIFQELPISTAEDNRKVQLLVSRLTSEPPQIEVSQLFYIRESLLGSALNTLATYFIVLMQMRQMTQDTSPGAVRV